MKRLQIVDWQPQLVMPMYKNLLIKSLRIIKMGGLASLRLIGGFRWIAASSWRRQRLLILCYHGVSLYDEHEWHPELFVDPSFLRRRFEMLRDGGYTVMPLAKAVSCLQNGTLPPRSVVLTFDDGFYNFFAKAVPLLEEFGYPATVYLTTYYCLHQRPILRLTVRYLLWMSRSQVLPAGTFSGQNEVVDLREERQRDQLCEKLLVELHTHSANIEVQQALLGQFAEQLGLDLENIVRNRLFHLMTETEVADVARRGFDVQLHTYRHRTPREETAFKYEILENRHAIEKLTGVPAIHFCYPSGDTDTVFLPWLHDLSVETATTCATGLVKIGQDPLMLPRFVDTMAQNDVVFEGWLCGAAAFLNWRKR